MPIYTYQCDNCGVQFEKQQKFSEQPLSRCPECGKKSLKKVYLPVGIVFKGSGFYATDHHSPSGQYYKADKDKDEAKKDSGGTKEPKDSAPKPKKESEKTSE